MSDSKRYTSLAGLRAVIGYEWSARHAWGSRRAALRGLWWTFVRRYAYEICEDCGRPVDHGIGDTFWRAPDELWIAVVGSPGGVLCPGCFLAKAEAKGARIYWQAAVIASFSEVERAAA